MSSKMISIHIVGNSLAVQWLGLSAFTAGGACSIPGQETKILQPSQCRKKHTHTHIHTHTNCGQ